MSQWGMQNIRPVCSGIRILYIWSQSVTFKDHIVVYTINHMFFEHAKCHTCMMTSSNGNIFRVTGPLCGEFTGPGEFPTQRQVTRSFDVYFDLRLNKRLCKQSWDWWFETLFCPLWRHSNQFVRSLRPVWMMQSGRYNWQAVINTILDENVSALSLSLYTLMA